MPPPPTHGSYVNHFPNPKTNLSSAAPRRTNTISGISSSNSSVANSTPSLGVVGSAGPPAEKQQQLHSSSAMPQTPQQQR